MNAKNEVRDALPETFDSIEAAADFWDNHDLSDYWDCISEATFEVDLEHGIILVPLEQNIAHQVADAARKQGLSTEIPMSLS